MKETLTKTWMRFLGLCLLLTFLFCGKTADVQAAAMTGTYPSITLNCARYMQIPDGCGVCAMAMTEGSFFETNLSKVYSNTSRSDVYNKTIAYNKDNQTYAYWNGYLSITASSKSAYLTALYTQLAEGYPVIVYRQNGDHYAVVYAYTGSKTSLEMSGFKVYNDTRVSCNSQTLTQWFSGHTMTYRYIARRTGIYGNTLVSNITFAVNHPETYHKKGTTHAVYGRVVSNKKLTSVVIGVYKTDGTKVFSKSFTPNVYNFNVNQADSAMTFKSLANGSYYYRIYAKDAGGRYRRYQFAFRVVSSAVSSPKANTPTVKDMPTVAVTSVSLDTTSCLMFSGAQRTLTATVLPSNATNKKVSWSSSNTSVVTVDSSGKCTAGSAGSAVVTAKASDGSGKTATCKITVIGVSVYVPTFSTSNIQAPSGKYAQGRTMTLLGTVTSDAKITSLKVEAVNSAGTSVLAVSASPNATSYNIYNLDANWTFRKLPTGTYTFKITAQNEKMSSAKEVYTSSFTITSGTGSISSYTYPSGTLTYGKTFAIKGTIKATNSITKVEAGVKNTATGATAFSKSVSPNATSYSLANIDSYMTFRSLAKGNYWYYVKITESNGVQAYLLSSSFTVA